MNASWGYKNVPGFGVKLHERLSLLNSPFFVERHFHPILCCAMQHGATIEAAALNYFPAAVSGSKNVYPLYHACAKAQHTWYRSDLSDF